MAKKIVIIGSGLRRIPVIDGEALKQRGECILTDKMEAFVFEPSGLRHDPPGSLTKRSQTPQHKELMRKGRREFHKKGR